MEGNVKKALLLVIACSAALLQEASAAPVKVAQTVALPTDVVFPRAKAGGYLFIKLAGDMETSLYDSAKQIIISAINDNEDVSDAASEIRSTLEENHEKGWNVFVTNYDCREFSQRIYYAAGTRLYAVMLSEGGWTRIIHIYK